jgi:hypothetical protein
VAGALAPPRPNPDPAPPTAIWEGPAVRLTADGPRFLLQVVGQLRVVDRPALQNLYDGLTKHGFRPTEPEPKKGRTR